MVIGTSNCGLKFSRTYSLESFRLTNTAIWPGRLGGSALTALSAPGRRAVSFFTSGATAGVAGASAVALTGSAGFSVALDSAGLASGVLASGILVSSTLVIAAVGASTFTASDLASALASAFLSSAATVPVSVDLMSGAAVSIAGSDCVASGFASAFGASLAGRTLAADGVASDMVTTPLIAGNALLASAVRVCSRNGAWPTVGRRSRLASECARL